MTNIMLKEVKHVALLIKTKFQEEKFRLPKQLELLLRGWTVDRIDTKDGLNTHVLEVSGVNA